MLGTAHSGTQEANVLFNDALNILFIYMTYGKGPLRQWEKKPTATTTLAARVLLYSPSETGQHIP